ncbi:Protein LSM12 homolog A [Eumeta japonica]|uniref:Protein LSM12 homolog A n=1 Tax=Eumeta variegata TaxID=151549 RepID=A0A4C2A6B5_EUMVA|nr:Protein LSM12 homolog A [Eumeta japonica]
MSTAVSDCFTIGSIVACKTCYNEDIEGEVLAFDPHTRMLILKCPSSSGDAKRNDVNIVNLSLVSEVQIKREVTTAPEPPQSLNLHRLNTRVRNSIETKRRLVGRLVCAEQQLCLAHGINLAVCDVLYKKHNYLQDSPTSDDMDDNNDDDHLEDLDCSESEDVEFELVNKIVDVLTPIKLTVEAICRRDANLCTADAALNFLIKQLSSKTQHLPKIKTCLVDRIKQRRSDNLTGVLNYLQNPRKDEENQLLSELEWHNLFPVPTQALLRKQIKSIVKRLNSRDDTEEEERSESLTDVELGQKHPSPN